MRGNAKQVEAKSTKGEEKRVKAPRQGKAKQVNKARQGKVHRQGTAIQGKTGNL
jgi:hypothetical protein